MPTHWPGSLVDLDALYALARRARPARDRGRRARAWARSGRAATSARSAISSRSASTRTRTSRRSRAARWSSTTRTRRRASRRCASTASRYLPDRTRDVAFPGRQVQPARRQRADRRRAARRGCPSSSPRAARWPHRYFERFATDPACLLPPRPRDGDGQSWNMWSVLLPLDRLTIDRRQFRDALDARGIGTGVSYEALHLSTLGRRLRRARGPVSEHRAHRARDGDAAAARRNDRRRRRPRLRRRRRSDRCGARLMRTTR